MRTFFNVGNALFTVERVWDKNFVYDCGGQSLQLIDSAINQAFHSREDIEAVFISHYDKDHINGIHELLKHCNVKRIFLPNIPFSERLIYIFLQESLSLDDVLFISSPEEYIANLESNSEYQTRVYYIQPSDPENDNTNLNEEPIDMDNTERYGSEIKSGSKIRIKLPHQHPNRRLDWCFIPWNIKTMSSEEINTFNKDLLEVSTQFSIEEDKIKDLWTNNNLCHSIKDSFKRIVTEARYNINALSMTVYSGPINPIFHIKLGCLYTGDFDAKLNFDKLKKAYSVYWDSIGIIQIPHHGSDKNFNEQLLDENKLAIVSLGYPILKNRLKTMKKIIELRGTLLYTGNKDIKICHMLHPWEYSYDNRYDIEALYIVQQ